VLIGVDENWVMVLQGLQRVAKLGDLMTEITCAVI
jgi:hypothetical protein